MTGLRMPPVTMPQLAPATAVKVEGCQLPSPLAAGERGGLIFPKTGLTPTKNGVIANSVAEQFNPDMIRGALLLFDRLDNPENSMIQIDEGAPPGLEDWTGFQRTRAQMSGQISAHVPAIAFTAAFTAHEERETGLWAVVVDSDEANPLPKDTAKPETAFRLKLIDALPIPDRSVPYEDVLNFKERRKSELAALRHHLEELVLEVAKSGNNKLAETVAFERFHSTLSDHAAVSREANFLKRLASLDVKVQWDKLADPAILARIAAAGATTYAMPGLPAAWAALGLAALPMLGVESTIGTSAKKSGGPFEYLFKAGREL